MFLHCPPWRKPRPASPSDAARSYQASHPCGLEAQRHRTQGTRQLIYPFEAPCHRAGKGHSNKPQNHILHQTIHRLRTRNTTPRASRASFAADSLASTDHPALTMSHASSCLLSLARRQDLLQNRLPRLRHWEAMAAA